MGKTSGFTLVELSIVLVIISLITAGIVSGREMIHTSRLTSIMNDFVKYETAFNLFQAKYDAIPGDFDEASDYWPGQTEEGDGSHTITTPGETTQFWDHLALAGLIEGTYDETEGNIVIGTSRPKTAMEGVTFSPTYVARTFMFSLDVAALNDQKSLYIYLARSGPSYNVLTPEDTKYIDKKLDNGMPGTGKIFGYSGGKACANNHTLAAIDTDTYDVSNTSEVCSPFYLLYQ